MLDPSEAPSDKWQIFLVYVTHIQHIFSVFFLEKELDTDALWSPSYKSVRCCGCSTLHMWWLWWQLSPGGLSAVSDPLVWVCIPIPLPTPSLMFAALFPSNPRHYGRGGWCWQPVSVRRSSQLSRTQAVHPERELQSTVISRMWSWVLGLWGHSSYWLDNPCSG